MRIIPPVYMAGAMATMWGLDTYLPVWEIIPEPARGMGWLFLIAGGVIIAMAGGVLKKADTPIHPFREANTLVTEGVYAQSRNPIYLAMAVMLGGLAGLLGSFTPYLVIPVFILVIQERVIKVEEAMLEEKFGETYTDYAKEVRRWM